MANAMRIGHALLRKKTREGWICYVDVKRGKNRLRRSKGLGRTKDEALKRFPQKAEELNRIVADWLLCDDIYVQLPNEADVMADTRRTAKWYQAKAMTAGPATWWR